MALQSNSLKITKDSPRYYFQGVSPWKYGNKTTPPSLPLSGEEKSGEESESAFPLIRGTEGGLQAGSRVTFSDFVVGWGYDII